MMNHERTKQIPQKKQKTKQVKTRGKQRRKRTRRKEKKEKIKKDVFQRRKEVRKYSNGSPCLYNLRHGVEEEEEGARR